MCNDESILHGLCAQPWTHSKPQTLYGNMYQAIHRILCVILSNSNVKLLCICSCKYLLPQLHFWSSPSQHSFINGLFTWFAHYMSLLRNLLNSHKLVPFIKEKLKIILNDNFSVFFFHGFLFIFYSTSFFYWNDCLYLRSVTM